MGLDAVLSFGCAALAAVGNAVANVMQRKASLQQGDPDFDAHTFFDLIRRPTWLLGFFGMISSFLLQAIALDLGPLASVEPVITLEVPLTLLVASWVFTTHIGRGEWTGIWAMTAGMIVLVLALNPQPGNATRVNHGTYLAAGLGTAATIIALLVSSRFGRRIWRTACLGAAAGVSFGLTATLIKETVTVLSDRGVAAMFMTWQTYAAAAVGMLGIVIMQAALHSGPLLAAQPGFTLADPLVSILWGVLVYHETTRSSAGWLAIALLGSLGIVAGVMLLCRSPLLTALNEDDMSEGPSLPNSPKSQSLPAV